MGTGELMGVQLSPLKRIEGSLGDVYHALKGDESSFNGFGEAYFSTVLCDAVKGWKKHTRMTANLVVPVGEVRFVLYDPRPDSDSYQKLMDVRLSPENYQRLSIPPGIWFAFQGCSKGLNLILNISNILHDPAECDNLPLQTPDIPFQFL